MAWQDMFAGSATRIDAEHEQELRLAAQARMGADWALGALVARYQPTVIRYLTRLTGNSLRTRILSEQIFLRMERRLHGPHGGQHLRLWLLRACTESGLDELRKPHQTVTRVQLDIPRAAALLPERNSSAATQALLDKSFGPTDRLRAGIGTLADKTSVTSRQIRQLLTSAWSDPTTRSSATDTAATAPTSAKKDSQRRQAKTDARSPQTSNDGNNRNGTYHSDGLWDDTDVSEYEEETEPLQPREVLRYRMIRAVLAELPYGDAQCLALHLIAGLNQAEVARALGITSSATRRRIVQGLQLFAQRYDAAVASLGFSLDGEAVPDDASAILEPPEDARSASLPGQRAPIVVSARLTKPLPLDLTEEPTVVWDLPPFPDMAEAQHPSPATTADATETTETPPSTVTISELGEEDDVAWTNQTTRRVIWSRPPAALEQPAAMAYSGEEVTIRVPRPYGTEDDPGNQRNDNAEHGAGRVVQSGVTQPLVEPEIMTVLPPDSLVVDADILEVADVVDQTVHTVATAPSTMTRVVPTLTSDKYEPPHGQAMAPDAPSSSVEARVISVLTPAEADSPPTV